MGPGSGVVRDARGAILTVAAALIAATAAGAGPYVTARTIRINQYMLAESERANRASDQREREAQITDRYTKAIEQLGRGAVGCAARRHLRLELVVVNSERNHPTVVEVLSAFVRVHRAPRCQYMEAGPARAARLDR